MKGLSPNQWTTREFPRMFTSCLQIDFSETLKVSEIKKKKDFPPNFMLVIVFRINICSNCDIGLQPTKSFFFDPNSDLNCHFKMSFDPWVGKISWKKE